MHEPMFERPQGKPWGRSVTATLTTVLITAALCFQSFLDNPVLVRAEDALSEIPGIPWSGAPVNSSAGGAIIDRVWRLVVTSPRQAIISVNGAIGAELGLYLFGSGSTSIATSTPIATSAKPGRTQRISAPLSPGTYYVNVNGRNTDRPYAFVITIDLIADPTPPFVKFVVENGKSRVASSTPAINITATDSLTGIDAVRMRSDGGEWGPWVNPSEARTVELPETEGLHRVGVQARNGVGLIATAPEATVYLDLTAPIGERIDSPNSPIVSSSMPKITIRFNEPMDATSWNRGGIILEDPDGVQLSGNYFFDSTNRLGSFVPTGLQPGVQYVVRLGTAFDAAGNLAEMEPSTITYIENTKVNALRTNIKVLGTAAAQLQILTVGIDVGEELSIERLESLGGDSVFWETVGIIKSLGDSKIVRFNVVSDRNSVYVVRYLGSEKKVASRTPNINVVVAPVVRPAIGTALKKTLKSGSLAPLSFVMTPNWPAKTVLNGYICTKYFTGCKLVSRITLTPDASGQVTYQWTARRGSWVWRLNVPPGPSSGSSLGPAIRLTVQ